MPVDQAISVAGVTLALAGVSLPQALRPWRADPRGAGLTLRVHRGRPLVPPGTQSAFAHGHQEFSSGADRLVVASWRGHTHLVTRDLGGAIVRSARFDADASVVDVTVSDDAPHAALDRGLLEWLLLTQLARRGGFVLNGCAVVRDGRAMVFAGGPGSGRSTLARLFARDAGMRVLTDDRVALYETPGAGFVATAWPWPDDGAFRRRGTGVLQACHRIHRAPDVIAEPFAREPAVESLFGVAVRPAGDRDGEVMVREAVARCTDRIPTIRLGCPPDGRLLRYVGGTPATSDVRVSARAGWLAT